MKKQFVAIFLAALMLFGLSVPAMAEGSPSAVGRYVAGKTTITVTGLENPSEANYIQIQENGKRLASQDVVRFKIDSDGVLTTYILQTLDKIEEKYYKILVQKNDQVLAEGWVTFTDLQTFTVTFDSDGGSEVPAQTVEEGQTAAKPADPTKAGFVFAGWYLDEAEYKFDAAVTADITLTAKWTEDSVEDGQPATITVDGVAVEGDYVTGGKFTLPAAPAEVPEGKVFKGWLVNGGKTPLKPGTEITINATTMTIVADFQDEQVVDPKPGDKDPVAPTGPSGSKPGTTDPGTTEPDPTDPGITQPGTVISVFTDITGNDWYVANGALQYVYDNGLMTGTSATAFSPNAPTSRAQIMVILARRAGVDTSGSSVWYQKGLDWAVANQVSDGSDPNGNISREMLATMLYRLVGAPSVTGDLSAYPDAASVSDWATAGMTWATQNGIIGGTETGALNPQGNATRAEVATMLMRFCQQYPV